MTDAGAEGDEAPRRWSLAYPLIGFPVAFLAGILGASLFLPAGGSEGATFAGTIAFFLLFWAGLLAAAAQASRRQGSGRLPRDFALRFRPVDVPLGIVVGLASQIVLLRIVYLPLELFAPEQVKKLDDAARETLGVAQGWGWVVLGIAVIVGAPLVEELFFRGLLQDAVVSRLGPGPGVVLTAVAFGITHGQSLQLAGLVAFGIVLGVLREQSQRLGPGLVAHAAFNGLAVLSVSLG